MLGFRAPPSSSPSAPTRRRSSIMLPRPREAFPFPFPPPLSSPLHAHTGAGTGTGTASPHHVAAGSRRLCLRFLHDRRSVHLRHCCPSRQPRHRILGALQKFPAFFLFLLGLGEAFPLILNHALSMAVAGSRRSMAIFPRLVTKRTSKSTPKDSSPGTFTLAFCTIL